MRQLMSLGLCGCMLIAAIAWGQPPASRPTERLQRPATSTGASTRKPAPAATSGTANIRPAGRLLGAPQVSAAALAGAPASSTGGLLRASVNGSPITEAHVQQAIAGRWATPILRSLIEERLIRQEARRQGIKISPEQIEAKRRAERAQFPSEAAFQRHLRMQGYSDQAYREHLITEAMLDQLLARQTAVTEEEIRGYYLEHQAEFTRPAQIHPYVIMTNTIEEAYLARERLASGEKFEAVARELSKAPSKDKGGDLGWITPEQLGDKTLSETAQTLEPGIVSNPLRVHDRYYLLLIRERRPAQMLTLAEARPQIEALLRAQKAVSPTDYLAFLARQAAIEIHWPAAQYLAEEYRMLRVIGVAVKGERLELLRSPVRLPSGTIIVPAKPVLEAIGAVLTWQAREQTLIARLGERQLKLTANSPRFVIVSGGKTEIREMPEPAVMRDGMLFFAPRAPIEALGGTVRWDALRYRLVIDLPSETMPRATTGARPSGLERQ